jgi:hypothetical protein
MQHTARGLPEVQVHAQEITQPANVVHIVAANGEGQAPADRVRLVVCPAKS